MRRLFLLTLLIAFTINLQGQDFRQRWSNFINQGKTEYKVENYGNALQLFQKAARIIPTDTTAYQYMIDCAFKVHKPGVVLNAVEKLKTIHKVKPQHYAYAIASAYSYQKKYEKALRYVQEAKAKFPDNKRILLEEANVYYDYGDFSTAVEKLNHMINNWPESPQAYDLLIKIHKEVLKNYEQALKIARHGIAQLEDNLEYKKQETDILLRLDRIEEAREKLTALVKENPDNPTLYYNLALTHYETGDYKKSAEICKKAIELDPGFVEAYYNVGAFYYNYGLSYTEALGNMSLAQYNNQGRDIENKAITYLEKARPYYKKAIALNPDELDAYKSLNTIDVLLENLRANRAALHETADTSKIAASAAEPGEASEVVKDTLARDTTTLAAKPTQENRADTLQDEVAAREKTAQHVEKEPAKPEEKPTEKQQTAQAEPEKTTDAPARETMAPETAQLTVEEGKRVTIKRDEAAPAIVDIHFRYPNTQGSLEQGNTGTVEVTIGNQGRQPADAEFLLMEPVISPHLQYQRKNPVKSLAPGQVATLEIPLHYKPSDATTVEIDQLRLKQKKFRALVTDASGFRSGLVEFTVNLGKSASGQGKGQSQVSGLEGQNYLLLMGAGNYPGWDNTSGSTAQLKELQSTLQTDYQFAPQRTFTLFGEKLTLFNLRNALIRLKKAMGRADNLVMVFAGKSWYDINADEAYWVPAGAEPENPKEYLAAQSLISYLEDLNAKHIVLFTEGVFNRSRIIPDAPDNFKADNDGQPSRWILCGHQAADSLTNSPDHAYLKFLNRSLAENTRPQIAVSEIVNYMKMIMRDKTARRPVGGPLEMSGNQYGDYIFYRRKAAAKEE